MMGEFEKCGICGDTYTVHGMPAHMYLKHKQKYPRFKEKTNKKFVRIAVTEGVREKLRALRTREFDTYDKIIEVLLGVKK